MGRGAAAAAEEAEAEAEAAGDAAAVTGGSGSSHRFLDRSKVRILLCDSDPKSSEEVLHLLSKCSYQVTSVRSARRVIDVLNAQGSDIDIILAEVDLPVAKGFKMLKYITRNKDLRRIPIIMMSAQDEVPVVVKCLRLGAADYLVKPLRTNELLNLWTHVWRRRRMLGLSEKDIFSHDFELVLSDPSDANTNSTTLLSDDTDDKKRENANQETGTPILSKYEFNASVAGHEHENTSEDVPDIAEDADQALFSGGAFSRPRKTNLKIAESSAFLAYVRSSTPTINSSCYQSVRDADQPEPLDHRNSSCIGGDYDGCSNREAQESCSDRNDFMTRVNVHGAEAFQMPMEFPVACFPSSNTQPDSSNKGQVEASAGAPSVFRLPFYYPGLREQGVVPFPMQMFPGGLNNVQPHGAPALMPQYTVYSQCTQMSMAPPLPYNPVHMAAPNLWPSLASTPIPEAKSDQTERRAAALVKFRQKRKERCFDKKIRYINRKRLAETRPRVRGQFVSHANNTDDNSDEDDDGDPISRDIEIISSPE